MCVFTCVCVFVCGCTYTHVSVDGDFNLKQLLFKINQTGGYVYEIQIVIHTIASHSYRTPKINSIN